MFDALISRRPYKPAWPRAQALEEIARGSGGHFDPTLVAAFLELASENDGLPAPAPSAALELDSIPPLVEPSNLADERAA